MNSEIGILVADDHTMVLRALRNILNTRDMKVVGEARNSEEVFDELQKKHVDVVLLDISFPGESGLDILRELKKDHPDLPVLILSMHSKEWFERPALNAGAFAYVSKSCDPQELIDAIKMAAIEKTTNLFRH